MQQKTVMKKCLTAAAVKEDYYFLPYPSDSGITSEILHLLKHSKIIVCHFV